MNIIDKIRAENMGFITDQDLPAIIAHNRLELLLVRCGGGRFMCPAQDLNHFIDLIERDGREYVRDVSLPARRQTT